MAMKTISCKIAKAASALCLFSLTVSVTKAQEDRGERLQESISSSDQRTDFSVRKAAPSKIDSFTFQDLLKAREKCKEAQQRFEKSKERYRQEKSKARLSSTDASRLKKARAELDEARAALKTAEGTVKAAERKANAD
jgi:hypothetical protein